MDEFQKIWGSQSESTSLSNYEDVESLDAKLITKSESIFKKMSKVMTLDAILMVITSISFIAIAFVINLERKYEVSSILFGVMVILSIHYWLKRKFINNNDYTNHNISSLIRRKLKYLKWNSYLYIVSIPSVTLGSYLYLLTIDPNYLLLDNVSIPIQIIIGAFLLVFTFLFSKWLYSKLYGREIRILENLINELGQ